MTNEITALLIDDEQDSREVLENRIKKYCPEINIVGKASNAEDAFLLVKTLKPQLVFLDIQMPMGSGFSFLKKFNEVPFEVIFVTSYDEYAINAIKFSALDYLLKPVETTDLKNAVEKASRYISQKMSNGIRVVNLLNNIQTIEHEQKIAVHVGDSVRILNVSNIEYIEGDGRYSQIVSEQNEFFLSTRTLKEFEEYLGTQKSFLRINKSIIVNASKIISYSKGDNCNINLSSGASFEVSRRKKQVILEVLKEKLI